MNAKSILLILQLVSEWTAIAREINVLVKRVQAGEEITEAEIEAAREQAAASVAKWDRAAGAATDTTKPS